MAPGTCSVQGNSDFYGPGIRVGIYTQILSTLISNHLVPDDIGGNATGNLIFVSALLLAFIKSITDNPDLLIAEAFVILQLILVFFLAVTPRGLCFFLTEWLIGIADGSITRETRRKLDELEGHEVSALIFRTASKLGEAFTDISPLRRTTRWLLVIATAGLNLWFWTSGVSRFEHSTPPGCSTYVFLFARVGIKPPSRAVFILGASLYLFYHTIMLVG